MKGWQVWLMVVGTVALVRAAVPPIIEWWSEPLAPEAEYEAADAPEFLQESPAQAQEPTQRLPDVADCTPAGEAGLEAEEPVTEDSTLATTRRDYAWEYDGFEWTWSLEIYDEAYQYYHERQRPEAHSLDSDYAIYATDPYSQPLVHELACAFKDTAVQEGWPSSKGVELALAFVQSLPYSRDDVSAGFDEYPRFPLETLYDNGGDCEDTAILFASIVKAMGFGVVMLAFDADSDHEGHMMAAVKGSNLGGVYYVHGGDHYYATETVTEGYRAGEVPPGFEGDQAHIVPLTPKARLDHLDWESAGYHDGLYHYTVTLHNGGSLDARNLHVMMGYEAGPTLLWNSVTFNDGSSLAVDETLSLEISLRPPPRGETTRLVLVAWADNAALAKATSAQFTA